MAFLPLLFDSALFHLLDFELLFDLFFLLVLFHVGFSVGSKDGLDIGLNIGTFVGNCVGDLVGLNALEGTVNNYGLDEGSVVGANERLSDGVVLRIRFILQNFQKGINHIQSCLSIFLFLCHSCKLSLVHLTTGCY